MPDADRKPVRVLLVDDHQMFVESLARVLADDGRIDEVGVASTAAEARKLADENRPRVGRRPK